ncbi:hypothetical protein O6H91_16G001000 [Diphasiastrum complanatum]|uniref:Uncharacterized protein n=1 Tax=Diphasiastrum complanatum TaxID=34168 RepID=A0ACC2B991_DIPCM|nr:hypothetical protein O6H91_16G001000 [Diphasiastrum complanatum]
MYRLDDCECGVHSTCLRLGQKGSDETSANCPEVALENLSLKRTFLASSVRQSGWLQLNPQADLESSTESDCRSADNQNMAGGASPHRLYSDRKKQELWYQEVQSKDAVLMVSNSLSTRKNVNSDAKSEGRNEVFVSEPGRLSTSQHRGEVPQPIGRWEDQTNEEHRRIWHGTFNAEKDAPATAYDRTALKIRGYDPMVNFDERYQPKLEEAFLSFPTKERIIDMLRKHRYDGELDLNNKTENVASRTAASRPYDSSSFFMQKFDEPETSHRSLLDAMPLEHLFEKALTPSDVGKLNRLVIPKQHAERCFPLDITVKEKGLLLSFDDSNGKTWRFRYSYWSSSQSYVLTRGWTRFVKEKKLDVGDSVSFFKGLQERLHIDYRHKPTMAIPANISDETGPIKSSGQQLASLNASLPTSKPYFGSGRSEFSSACTGNNILTLAISPINQNNYSEYFSRSAKFISGRNVYPEMQDSLDFEINVGKVSKCQDTGNKLGRTSDDPLIDDELHSAHDGEIVIFPPVMYNLVSISENKAVSGTRLFGVDLHCATMDRKNPENATLQCDYDQPRDKFQTPILQPQDRGGIHINENTMNANDLGIVSRNQGTEALGDENPQVSEQEAPDQDLEEYNRRIERRKRKANVLEACFSENGVCAVERTKEDLHDSMSSHYRS